MAVVTATSIGNAIFMACRQLPEGYTIEVTLENGAATAECYDDEGEKISPEIGLGFDIDDEITEFIGMAHRHSLKRKEPQP